MNNTAEIEQLSVAFRGRSKIISALDKVSFNLIPGETLVLLGESGCGKSLTSLALMRLLPQTGAYEVNSQIHVDGQDILNLPEYMMRELRGKKLAMIFQEPMTALNPVMTIGNQITEIILRQKALSAPELKKALLDLLIEVEMPQPEVKIHQYPHQLSGGQKQRVVIAMALACKPDILIADEPTTALDVTIQAQILTLLKKLQSLHQMSLLLITHDLGVVKAMADRVCVMYAGQIVEQSMVKDFFSHVGHPYVQQLLASLPSFAKREEKLSVINGSVPALDALPSGCRFHPRCIYAFDRCRTEEPQLLHSNERMIRCHLYPEIKELPLLKQNKSKWQVSSDSAEIIFSVTDLTVIFEQKKRLLKPLTAFLFGCNKEKR
jgi:oligopeptide/dipeptide ABC transporter ATP-binding protein